ncbi:MAG: elongation factor Ts [Alphaproteobacteria bacterium]|nr:elongation factor Ts [Alphaproteobacteria bacterium]
MAEITAALVKDLREKTGAGMMDCKKALAETQGNLEAAVDWLRAKGLSAAAKKAGRVASEGLVGLAVAGNAGAVVEVNSETDFVARNDKFQAFVREVVGLALKGDGTIDRLKATAYPGTGRNVEQEVANLVGTIGENMAVRRAARLAVDQGAVVGYVHNAAGPGIGKIAVLVGLKSAADKAKLEVFGKQLAMHVAAANPQSVDVANLDQTAVEREKAILVEQAKTSGKPANIIDKMVEGRVRKFYQDVVLLEQTWVIDGESRVAKVVEQAAKDAGAPITVTGFVRFQLGEGIEKKQTDFAAEVAAQVGR